MIEPNVKNVTYEKLCTYDNLFLAYQGARKHKTLKPYVIEFEKELNKNLLQLQHELTTKTYHPRPLETFILRDPKTRKISKSNFRDRVIHHAICNIIEPIFDKTFIQDSYANRLGKGTLKSIERFDKFKRQVSKNNSTKCYFLKADIKHYFDNVNHQILIGLIKKRIFDEDIIWVITQILQNHKAETEGKGMPLGNLTSQFFANIYLNELDQYVKHQLKSKYYLRYVDDFIILDTSIDTLIENKLAIESFLKKRLCLELHPDKSKIFPLEKGANFLGFRIFYNHKLVRKKNIKKFDRKFQLLKKDYEHKILEREKAIEKFEGWLTYISHADTYKYRKHLTRELNQNFPLQPTIEITNIKKHENHIKRTEHSEFEYSPQKTLQLYTKGLNIKKIAEQRKIKESTVWKHLEKLIEHNQISIWTILQKDKIITIKKCIYSEQDTLKEIKQRINNNQITFDEISCILADIKSKNKTKNVLFHINWYKRNHCFRKCYGKPKQREECQNKLEEFTKKNPTLTINRKEFLELFNNHIKICILPEKEKQKYITWQEFKNKRTQQYKS
ncbi:MAG: reverse transcriptase domain-containing protein [Candidatus Woesearchaeota archaeon]|jgi:retron-type reverse transcriptase